MRRNYELNGVGYTVEVDPEIQAVDENSDINSRRSILFSSSNDFSIYDDFLYGQMTDDEPRTAIYEQEIRGQVLGKTVLDIGTGAHANWAMFAAECGAAKVYGIEGLKVSYEAALELVRNSPHADKITLLYGLSTEVSLPEKVDICISEILGCPVSSEGVAPVLLDAKKRFLKKDGSFIIDAGMTKIAACWLDDEFKGRIGIHETDVSYMNEAFSVVGRPFDIRVVIDNFPQEWIVSTEGVVEKIRFNDSFSTSQSMTGVLEILRDTQIDGFAGWINVIGGKHSEVLDTLHTKTTWLPIYLPVFYPCLVVKKGDLIKYRWSTSLKQGAINPDYSIAGSVIRGNIIYHRFEYSSPHASENFGGCPFYKTIFPSKLA